MWQSEGEGAEAVGRLQSVLLCPIAGPIGPGRRLSGRMPGATGKAGLDVAFGGSRADNASMRSVPKLSGCCQAATWVLVGAVLLGGCASWPSGSARRTDTWAARRDQAVVRGMAWMETFLGKGSNLDEVGLDAVYIFLEIAASSQNAEIRTRALVAARRYARSVVKQVLADDAKPLDNGDLVDLMDLLAESEPLGLDARPLRARAIEALERCNTFKALHGVAFADLPTASEDDVFDTMMSVYSQAKAQAVCGRAFAVRPGLARMLAFVKARPLLSAIDDTSEGKQTFQDHAYLVTHVAYILSNYGRLQLRRADAPWVYRYLRANFDAVLADKDIELVAEFVDVFRSLGYCENDDADVRAGTVFLLGCQNADGSWGPWREEEAPYDAIHYTWCAVSALRGRVFLQGTAYERYLAKVLKRVNR